MVVREYVIEQRHDLLDEPVGESQLDELPLKECFLVLRVRLHIGRSDEPRRWVERDAAISIDRPRSKCYRRHVPFAGRAQADDEPLYTGRQARLVRMPHDRRVEQRRRLQRVFLREVTADQQLTVLAERYIGEQKLSRVLEAVKNELPGFLVPAVKFREQVVHQPIDFILRERHHPGDDPQSPLRIRKLERTDQYPRVGRLDENVGSLQIHGNFPVSTIIQASDAC